MASISEANLFLQMDLSPLIFEPTPSVLGHILLRFHHNGFVSVYPMTDDPERLADQLRDFVTLFHTQPGLVLATCGVVEDCHG